MKMSCASYLRAARPRSMSHAKQWTDEVENLYRFQQAGYRDEMEYKQIKQVDLIDRWPETGFVKKLQRRDNTFYYYNRKRESLRYLLDVKTRLLTLGTHILSGSPPRRTMYCD
ncbi:hypothetical protein SKAU_G00026710 [Synaphobranchus kaupii]|uniref:Meiosis expressed gene 1 protein homolog n=1 Tax=Synaphobranchus kaupii TaxID=118154 RepID=A0A9Q1GDV8_SYNKA|nr:hypothetical protein SKAU_G00026710 [Synaphobranchus kaupii]